MWKRLTRSGIESCPKRESLLRAGKSGPPLQHGPLKSLPHHSPQPSSVGPGHTRSYMNPKYTLRIVLFLTVLLIEACGSAFAGGILHVFPPKYQDELYAVARPTVLLSRTFVTVSQSSIEYKIDQNFYNDNDFPLNGLFILPVPKSAQSSVEIRVNGAVVPCDHYTSGEFFPILRELVTSIKDPSLLELAGKDVVVLRPVHIGVKQQKCFRIRYQLPVVYQNDRLDVDVPLCGERYSLGPVGELDISVRFKMDKPVRNIFSPSHHLTVVRESPYRLMVYTKAQDKRVKEDFLLVTTSSTEDLDLRLLTNRAATRPGTFMALISPPILQTRIKEPDKDVVLVLDISGSMESADLASAKASIAFALERMLNPHDRFNILCVGTRTRRLNDKMTPATEQNILGALQFVNSSTAAGGTDLYNGIIDALEQFWSRRRMCVVIVVGDGRGTIGVTHPESILEDVKRYNRMNARIFALALGARADVALMDRLAVITKGGSAHFSGKTDFGAFVSRFFATVSPPTASDMSLTFQDVTPDFMDPDPLPDLFGQESLAVLGRYTSGAASTKMKLKAKVMGKTKTLTKAVEFPLEDEANPFIRGIWGMRRMSRLLEKEWLKGAESEGRNQISALAKEFGFRAPSQALSATASPGRLGLGTGNELGRLLWYYKNSNVIADVQADGYQRVGSRVFRRHSGGWVDVDYKPYMAASSVGFLSENYFSLISANPEIGCYMALGPDVILFDRGTPVKVTSER